MRALEEYYGYPSWQGRRHGNQFQPLPLIRPYGLALGGPGRVDVSHQSRNHTQRPRTPAPTAFAPYPMP